jgi:hypothetical protein
MEEKNALHTFYASGTCLDALEASFVEFATRVVFSDYGGY